ncbi:MAG: RNA polymerase factor sigma-54 [Devosiaceae bacterium]|nr:RNA polymerase factor sigma-54 [Devosiaceae bacterium MH13]
MGLTPKLVLRQSQTLAITPQLMQAIKLLQLSTVELSAFVEQELVQNPLLERDERGDDEFAGEAAAPDPTESDGVADGADWASDELETSAQAIADKLDTAAENVFPDDASPASLGPSMAGPADLSDRPDFESFVARTETLHDHLNAQLLVAITDPAQRLIGSTLIDAVDDNGYLQAEVSDIAERLGATDADVEGVLTLIQTFDPAGVAARSLPECLALQLRERNRLDPAMRALLDNLPLAAKRDMPALRRLCGVDEEDLTEMLAELRQLDPKPGRGFSSTPVDIVVPDILVKEEPGGTWGVELNAETMPRLLVNRSYYAQIDRKTLSVEDRSYLSEKLQSANWLIKSLDQRARTMIKVGQEIVRQQDGFFERGIEHLKPLTLKQIADAIEMHESTVSRVTSNKYIATPRGTFELKYFFTAAIASTDGGDAHAAEAVRQRIKRLIDAEAPDAVLSDDQLVKALKDDGIDIARRTVAKYREAMRIASSVQRRREKKALLSA